MLQDPAAQRLYKIRMKCYTAALAVLESLTPPPRPGLETARSAVLVVMMNSHDRLFHEQMYEWFINHGKLKDLLHARPEYLEEVLI
jgi:hypothetical protein